MFQETLALSAKKNKASIALAEALWLAREHTK